MEIKINSTLNKLLDELFGKEIFIKRKNVKYKYKLRGSLNRKSRIFHRKAGVHAVTIIGLHTFNKWRIK